MLSNFQFRTQCNWHSHPIPYIIHMNIWTFESLIYFCSAKFGIWTQSSHILHLLRCMRKFRIVKMDRKFSIRKDLIQNKIMEKPKVYWRSSNNRQAQWMKLAGYGRLNILKKFHSTISTGHTKLSPKKGIKRRSHKSLLLSCSIRKFIANRLRKKT